MFTAGNGEIGIYAGLQQPTVIKIVSTIECSNKEIEGERGTQHDDPPGYTNWIIDEQASYIEVINVLAKVTTHYAELNQDQTLMEVSMFMNRIANAIDRWNTTRLEYTKALGR